MGEHCCTVDHSRHEEFEQKTSLWDRFGITLSSLCALHCLLTPFLILAVPALGESFESEWVHWLLAVVVVPVAIYAFWSGYKHHKKLPLVVLGMTGALMIGAAAVLPHEWVEFYEFDMVTIVGSLFLVAGHILNRRACLCHVHEVKAQAAT